MTSLFHWLVTRRRVGWMIAAVAALAIAGVFISRRPKPPSFNLLNPPVKWPVTFRDRFDRCLPRWPWIWGLEQAIFGKRTPVNVFTEIISLKQEEDAVEEFGLEAPTFSAANGVQVWLLDPNQINGLRNRLKDQPGWEERFRPRISTADGLPAEMFTGQALVMQGVTNEFGFRMRVCGWVSRNSIDLLTWVRSSEMPENGGPLGMAMAIQTNLDLAFRMRIPKGKGAFLIDATKSIPKRKRLAVLLEPPLP